VSPLLLVVIINKLPSSKDKSDAVAKRCRSIVQESNVISLHGCAISVSAVMFGHIQKMPRRTAAFSTPVETPRAS